MNIMIIHGYLLRGTGSNLYVSNLCLEFCKQGHDVSVVCQENQPEGFDYISEIVDFSRDNKKQVSKLSRNTIYPGTCILYRPNLDGFLPVFVYDKYEGFEVKEFTAITEEQIKSYIDKNQQALETIITTQKYDLFISNHTIMQPVYTSRALKNANQGSHFMVVHGSCLNFSVRKSELLKKYAFESIRGSEKIVFVSSHSKDEFMDFFEQDPNISEKTIIISAGVDIEKFKPLGNSSEKQERINNLFQMNIKNYSDHKGRTKADKLAFRKRFTSTINYLEVKHANDDLNTSLDNWTPDEDVAENLSDIKWNKDNVVLYYGKYLWTKGIQLLITAAPIVFLEHPETKFIVVGFGSYRGYLESLVNALETGNESVFIELLRNEKFFTNEKENNSIKYYEKLLGKLEEHDFSKSYFKAAKNNIADKIIFTGIMTHDELKDLIPVSNITIAASIFPEAFGMVAVEALASGVLPMQTNHSGFRDVMNVYIREFKDLFDIKRLQALVLDDDLIFNIANTINTFLSYYENMNEDELNIVRKRSRYTAEKHFSWTAIVKRFLQLAQK